MAMKKPTIAGLQREVVSKDADILKLADEVSQLNRKLNNAECTRDNLGSDLEITKRTLDKTEKELMCYKGYIARVKDTDNGEDKATPHPDNLRYYDDRAEE